MNKTLKITFLISLSILLLATVSISGFVLWKGGWKKQSAPSVGAAAAGTPLGKTPIEDVPAQPLSVVNGSSDASVSVNAHKNIASEADVLKTLTSLSLLFAERFGSYSSHSNYENIEKLSLYMTQSMKEWAEQYVQQERIKQPRSASGLPEYYGITTKAVSASFKAFDEEHGAARVTVATQRSEQSGTAQAPVVLYQNLDLLFVKEGDVWKVNKATWGGK